MIRREGRALHRDGPSLGRRRFLGAATLGGVGLVGAAARPAGASTAHAAMVASAPGLTGTTAAVSDSAVASAPPVAVPQLAAIPVTVYGHSWTVPAGWHGSGLHWSERFAAASGSGPVSNRGIGGTQLELLGQVLDADPAGAYGGWVWGDPGNPSVALVMYVYNSAFRQQSGPTVEQSVQSFELAARHTAASVLSTTLPAVSSSLRYTGGWAQYPDPMSATGRWAYSWQQGASITWVPTTSAPMAWVEVACYNRDSGVPFACEMQVRVGGETRYTGPASTSGRDAPGQALAEPATYMKVSVPIGAVTAGVPVVVTKASTAGCLVVDGLQILHGRHHVSFTKDNPRVESPWNPGDGGAAVTAHNAVLDRIKAEFDAFAPGGVSVLDLASDASFDPATMLWSGDALHPNDKGQAWLLGRLTNELAQKLPWTPRLHVL